jgi:hypothetical protein
VSDEWVHCQLCRNEGKPDRVMLKYLHAHLRLAHGETFEILTWPDGEPVVIDKTLEPDDFEEDAP